MCWIRVLERKSSANAPIKISFISQRLIFLRSRAWAILSRGICRWAVSGVQLHYPGSTARCHTNHRKGAQHDLKYIKNNRVRKRNSKMNRDCISLMLAPNGKWFSTPYYKFFYLKKKTLALRYLFFFFLPVGNKKATQYCLCEAAAFLSLLKVA